MKRGTEGACKTTSRATHARARLLGIVNADVVVLLDERGQATLIRGEDRQHVGHLPRLEPLAVVIERRPAAEPEARDHLAQGVWGLR